MYVSVMMQRLYQVVASRSHRFWVFVLEETTLPSTRVSVTVITLVLTVFVSVRASWSLNRKVK